MDPAKGKVKKTISEFNSIWNHVLILTTPNNQVLKYTKELSIISIFGNLLVKNKVLARTNVDI